MNETTQNNATLIYIPIEALFPHPDNPRKVLGDLTELAESIKVKGVMQNLTVVKGHARTHEEWQRYSKLYEEQPSEELRQKMNSARYDDGYTVIIGHRRTEAARIAGLTELPCIVVEMTEQEQVATMLLENIQRSDLTVYEQAQGFQMMLDLGDTVDSISEKTGFSKSTVRRRLKIAELDGDTLKEVSDRQLSLGDFERLDEIEDIKKRNKILKTIGTTNFENELAKAITEQKREAGKKQWLEELAKYGAVEISDEERYDSKYERMPYVSVEDDPVKKLKELFVGDGPFYYCIERWGSVCLRKAKAQETIDEEEMRRSEHDRKVDELRKKKQEIREVYSRAYELRRNYVMNISETEAKKHFTDTVRYMISLLYDRGAEVSEEDLACILGLENNSEKEKEAENLFLSQAEKTPYRSLLALAYASSDDGKNEDCLTWDCKYRQNRFLERLYDFLCSLGYEMSDEEQSLMDGSHELYTKDEPDESTD